MITEVHARDTVAVGLLPGLFGLGRNCIGSSFDASAFLAFYSSNHIPENSKYASNTTM